MHFKLPPIRVHLFGYLFSPGWLPTIATAILLALLIKLGFWQLDRAQQKRIIEQSFAQQTAPLPLAQISSPINSGLNYRTITVTGHFDVDHLIYLDNKIHQHKTGIQVLTPLIIAGDSRRLLVNRGFLARPDRSKPVTVATHDQTRHIVGRIYFPSKTIQFKEDSNDTPWPRLVQNVDIKKLEQALQAKLFPFIVLQENSDETSLIREWRAVNFPSSRHTGYAVQWFALALTLVIIYLKLNLRRHT